MTSEAWQGQPDNVTYLHEQLSSYDEVRLALMRSAAQAAGYFLLPRASSLHLDDLKWYLGAMKVDFKEEAALIDAVNTPGYDPTVEDAEQIGTFIGRLSQAMLERAPRNSVNIRTVGQTVLSESSTDLAHPLIQAVRSTEQATESLPTIRPNVLHDMQERLDPSILPKLEAYASFTQQGMDFTADTTNNFDPNRVKRLMGKTVGKNVEYNGYTLTERDVLLLIAQRYQRKIKNFPASYEDGEYPKELYDTARDVEFALLYMKNQVDSSAKELASAYGVSLRVFCAPFQELARTIVRASERYESTTGRPAFELIVPETSKPAELVVVPSTRTDKGAEYWPARLDYYFSATYDPNEQDTLGLPESLERGLLIGETTAHFHEPSVASNTLASPLLGNLYREFSDDLIFDESAMERWLPVLDVPHYDIGRVGFRMSNYSIENTNFPPVADIIDNPFEELIDEHEGEESAKSIQINPGAAPLIRRLDELREGLGVEDDAVRQKTLASVLSLAVRVESKDIDAEAQETDQSVLRKRIADQLRLQTGQYDRTKRLSDHDLAIVYQLASMQAAQNKLPEPPEFVANVRNLIKNMSIAGLENTTYLIPDYQTAKRALSGVLLSVMLERQSATSRTGRHTEAKQLVRTLALWANGVPDELIVQGSRISRDQPSVQVSDMYKDAVKTIAEAPSRTRAAIIEFTRRSNTT